MRTPRPDASSIASPEPRTTDTRYEPPSFELINLACEISAYAPDGDPLF